jgi:hypothetical protein
MHGTTNFKCHLAFHWCSNFSDKIILKCWMLGIWTINFPISNPMVCRIVVKYVRMYKLVESGLICFSACFCELFNFDRELFYIYSWNLLFLYSCRCLSQKYLLEWCLSSEWHVVHQKWMNSSLWQMVLRFLQIRNCYGRRRIWSPYIFTNIEFVE